MANHRRRHACDHAIKLDAPDPSWYNGPPNSVSETVFDETDQEEWILRDWTGLDDEREHERERRRPTRVRVCYVVQRIPGKAS
jgi:hypothetical protein